jgi:hypothetical protein
LLSRAWSLRRELSDKARGNPRTGLIIVGVVIPSGDAVAGLCGLDWRVVGRGWTLGLLYIVSSKDRTQHLIELIREARSCKAPAGSSTGTRLSLSVIVRAGTRRWPGANRGSLRDSHPRTTPNGAGHAAYPLTWANSEFGFAAPPAGQTR